MLLQSAAPFARVLYFWICGKQVEFAVQRSGYGENRDNQLNAKGFWQELKSGIGVSWKSVREIELPWAWIGEERLVWLWEKKGNSWAQTVSGSKAMLFRPRYSSFSLRSAQIICWTSKDVRKVAEMILRFLFVIAHDSEHMETWIKKLVWIL